MAAKLIPESIKDVFEYCPDTGDFFRIVSKSQAKTGKVTGGFAKLGYRRLCHKDRRYLAHRVAWFLMTGEQPPDIIDHIDHNPSNNRWCNLRASDSVRNSMNMRKQSEQLCGVRFAYNCWYARIGVRNKDMHLYCGPDFFEACCARKSAENRHHRPLLEDE